MSTAPASRGNLPLAIVLAVVGVVMVVMTIFYLTQQTSFLASHYGTQPKHALICAVVAVVALYGANIVRPRD